MKLVFNQNPQGCTLAYVECSSLEEADQFMSWYQSRLNSTPVQTVEATAHEEKVTPPNDNPKVTRTDVSQAAMSLVQTKGRQELVPILEKYNAKRISDIPDEKLMDAYADIKERA